MSTEELAKIIWDGAVADRVKDGKDPERVPVVRPKVEALADAILAAGYRKPQQVTTVEELDALANGSVVLDADRATATRLDADYWEVAGYASHFRIDAITLPATVLHVGGGGQ